VAFCWEILDFARNFLCRVRISGRCASEFLKAASHRDITGTRQAVGGGDIQNDPGGRAAWNSPILQGFFDQRAYIRVVRMVDFRVGRRRSEVGGRGRISGDLGQDVPGTLGLEVPATFGRMQEVAF
jgi:hypothetical protein